jgi:hypothetical protein
VAPRLADGGVIALWLSGRMICGLLLWLWAGERHLGLAIWLAGFVALLVSLTLFVRMATGRASRRYVQVTSWGAGLCACLYGAILFLDFADRIDGWSARGALENKYAFIIEGSQHHPPHLPRRIVDETTPVLASRGGKAFAIYVDDVRVLEARVMPRYRWWWSVSYSKFSALGVNMPVEEQLRRFKESLKKRRRREPKDLALPRPRSPLPSRESPPTKNLSPSPLWERGWGEG